MSDLTGCPLAGCHLAGCHLDSAGCLTRLDVRKGKVLFRSTPQKHVFPLSRALIAIFRLSQLFIQHPLSFSYPNGLTFVKYIEYKMQKWKIMAKMWLKHPAGFVCLKPPSCQGFSLIFTKNKVYSENFSLLSHLNL